MKKFTLQFRYDVQRGEYSSVEDKDVSFFEKLIGSQYVIKDKDEVEGHNVDFLRSVRGRIF